MAGLTPDTPWPTEITLQQASRHLRIEFSDGQSFDFPIEFLRVYSPSAEVRGHGPGQETLQTGKSQVGLQQISPVGQYAVQLHFTDGHNTGIYSWDYLLDLGKHQDEYWAQYLNRMEAAGASRNPT
ncbi:MAG: DUF971 domain-containing protein [Betaproteobacteria bacterium]|nr:DUF971 domain-containing protein [Betaproteobacteria bacterium]